MLIVPCHVSNVMCAISLTDKGIFITAHVNLLA